MHQEEYLEYVLPNQMIELAAIIVTPYRAYWQAEYPCYASGSIHFQIGKLSKEGTFILQYESMEYEKIMDMKPRVLCHLPTLLLPACSIIRFIFTELEKNSDDLYQVSIAHVKWVGKII